MSGQKIIAALQEAVARQPGSSHDRGRDLGPQGGAGPCSCGPCPA
jgi:hypothetical protein